MRLRHTEKQNSQKFSQITKKQPLRIYEKTQNHYKDTHNNHKEMQSNLKDTKKRCSLKMLWKADIKSLQRQTKCLQLNISQPQREEKYHKNTLTAKQRQKKTKKRLYYIKS